MTNLDERPNRIHSLHPRTTIETGSIQQNWWTTSGGSTFIPPGTENPTSTSSSHLGPPSSAGTPGTGVGGIFTTTFTTAIPVSLFTSASSTITLFSQSIVTSVTSLPPPSTTSGASSSSTTGTSLPDTGQVQSHTPVCIGGGLDAQSDGLIASLIVPGAIGLLIWLLFAILRPRFRQIYAVREWFVQQDLRPKPLGSGFFAWLSPHVPLVPDLADDDDVKKFGRSVTDDKEHFPSDGQLSQRALWIAFLIVLGWTVLGLGGALPLYLIETTCLAQQPSTAVFGGSYSALQDLSLLRLLQELDRGSISTTNLMTTSDNHILTKRADNSSDPLNIRPRIIVLTVFVAVLALLPALFKITKEFNKLAAYRKRWLEGKCQGKDLAWLSAKDAPGFSGWGEKRLKDFVLKSGLSSSLENDSRQGTMRSRSRGHGNGNGSSSRSDRRRENMELLDDKEKSKLEVDINGIFSVCDTQALAVLIEERDEILENLEIAETKYINSFKLSTPEPSLNDAEPFPPPDDSRPYISRPKKFGHRRMRSKNPAPAASSLAPTSFVAPSHYYKIGGVSGVSGGHFTDTSYEKGRERSLSFSDTFHSRIIGSRFQELNRDSAHSGQFPLGSALHVRQGTLELLGKDSESVSSFPIPDPRRYGPNYAESADGGLNTLEEEEWVDVSREGTPDEIMQSAVNGTGSAGPSFRRRSFRMGSESQSKRETFPFRKTVGPESPDDVPPPHLRLQHSQPFVRPLDGISYDHLGVIYSDIAVWRTKLKQINVDIIDAQRECYNDIAEGVRIKGWLFVGQGLRHIPKMQVIEGRSKDDVRWDILQNERTMLDHCVYYAVVLVATVLLAAGLTAASGLALATAPDFSHYLPFLQTLWSENRLAAGIVTVFVPAFAISLFVYIGLRVVLWASEIRATISVSAGQLQKFKATFYFLAIVSALWLVTVGALLFGIQAFSNNNDPARAVANGSIYMSAVVMAVVVQVAIILPGILILQPVTLWRVTRLEKYVITPRQRFRAVYPRTYQPDSFTATGACILAIVFASAFTLIFPLIGPAVVILLLLTLIAHRFLIGYVYAPNASTGGLLQIWLLRRLGTLLALQPLLVGLIFLSRRLWIEGGVLAGVAVFVVIFIEIFTSIRMSDRKTLSNITKDSVETFFSTARTKRAIMEDEESTSLVGSRSGVTRPRGSMASVLEMMSLTLAVMPSTSRTRGPIPLNTESLDDLLRTERAAQTHPDAPPHLPALPFADHAEEMAGILYAPELIAPPPIIWLPNDTPGVGRSEALDLQKYHDLKVTLDIGPGGTPSPVFS
ncbi:hypothetical protein E1B28_001554 [Marasmius oreades]|uniref:CSC1/OSCA1-like 7TM region domain-containing protein n=1 Tax=Marasmius oreades TaxID=181124 RepID=A0A9P7V3T9_9AGAR|nr:uncharacterized protein E1B28_001554 [Marasmius oreades]KAG7099739.1 hypothetical protein E1B28_001554 [Marasmius oreades]